MAAQTAFKMARVGGEALPLAEELIEEFKAKGYRGSLAGVVEAGVKVLHSHVLGGYHLLSHAESLEHRAQDVGTSIAAILGALCSHQGLYERMSTVVVSPIKLMLSVSAWTPLPDILIHAGGADPAAMIANVIVEGPSCEAGGIPPGRWRDRR